MVIHFILEILSIIIFAYDIFNLNTVSSSEQMMRWHKHSSTPMKSSCVSSYSDARSPWLGTRGSCLTSCNLVDMIKLMTELFKFWVLHAEFA